jgi:hypothetical protein
MAYTSTMMGLITNEQVLMNFVIGCHYSCLTIVIFHQLFTFTFWPQLFLGYRSCSILMLLLQSLHCHMFTVQLLWCQLHHLLSTETSQICNCHTWHEAQTEFDQIKINWIENAGHVTDLSGQCRHAVSCTFLFRINLLPAMNDLQIVTHTWGLTDLKGHQKFSLEIY